jgi:predicted nucleic acid-binding protein
MKIFLDANVLVSVLNKEYPLYQYSARILSLTEKSNYQVFTSPLCLAIAWYFSTKKSGKVLARKKIDLLLQNIHITGVNDEIVRQAVQNPQVHDFEDGMEYYSALASECNIIITENRDDFYFSEIDVLDCESFLLLHFSS